MLTSKHRIAILLQILAGFLFHYGRATALECDNGTLDCEGCVEKKDGWYDKGKVCENEQWTPGPSFGPWMNCEDAENECHIWKEAAP